MAGYSDAATAANDPAFINRIHAVMGDLAFDVLTEAESTPNHTVRLALAKKVLAVDRNTGQPNYSAIAFVLAGVLNADVDGLLNTGAAYGLSDNDLKTAIQNNWVLLAGEAIPSS